MIKKITLSFVAATLATTIVNADNASNAVEVLNSALQKVEASADAPDWAKRTSVKLKVEEGFKPTYELETVQPIVQYTKDDMLFWQFNSTYRDDINTHNLGLGYRNILNEDLMLGVNAFYDYQQDNKHKRKSIGVEAIGQTLEFRANKYMAISDKKEVSTDNWERVLDGYDAELGGTIPNTDLRAFATYTRWDAVDASSDAVEKSARIEYALNDSMKLEVAYANKDFDNNTWSAQLTVAFGAKSKSAKNLTTSTNLQDKFLIPVKRENEIVLEKSNTFTVTVGRK